MMRAKQAMTKIRSLGLTPEDTIHDMGSHYAAVVSMAIDEPQIDSYQEIADRLDVNRARARQICWQILTWHARYVRPR